MTIERNKLEALVEHQGVIRSLTPESLRAAVNMDPGPAHEVGVPLTKITPDGGTKAEHKWLRKY